MVAGTTHCPKHGRDGAAQPFRQDRSFSKKLALIAAISLVTIDLPWASEQNDAITLVLPVECELGSTCFFQNYFDHDPSSAAHDFRCGSKTYNGHNGSDIRLPDMAAEEAGVQTLAAAPGTVIRTRDGVEDGSVAVIGRTTVAGKECGNAVVIEHRGNWTTQYCHMRKGSIRVKTGDVVSVGQPIGLVGVSGLTEFPHLHLTVRKNGTAIDPFAYQLDPGSCAGGISLWASNI